MTFAPTRRAVLPTLAAAVAMIAAARPWAPADARAARPAPVAPPRALALAPGQMAVSAVTARYFKDSSGANRLNQNCSVVVVDSAGNPVDGATVTLKMTNDWVATLNVLTMPQPNWNNEVFAHVGRLISGQCGKKGLDAFTCTVVNVTHPSLTYVPAENSAASSTDPCEEPRTARSRAAGFAASPPAIATRSPAGSTDLAGRRAEGRQAERRRPGGRRQAVGSRQAQAIGSHGSGVGGEGLEPPTSSV